VLVGSGHVQEVFAAGQGLFGFEFGAEAASLGATWWRQILELSECPPDRVAAASVQK
jgi:hypothetical protein